MKPENYKSYYGLLGMPSLLKSRDDNYAKYSKEFWANFNPKKEKVQPEMVDQFGFVLVLKNLKDEKKIQSFLEELFSSYEGDLLNWLHYTLNWISQKKKHFEGWQIIVIEKWLTDKIDIYSKLPELKNTEPEPEFESLENMFSNSKDLQRITERLTQKSFVNNGIWQGKPDPVSGRNPKEKLLAALALVIEERNFLKKKHYQAKQMHKAFNDHFDISTGGRYFKPGQKLELEEYKRLFYFI